MSGIASLTTESGAHACGLAHGRRFAQDIAIPVPPKLTMRSCLPSPVVSTSQNATGAGKRREPIRLRRPSAHESLAAPESWLQAPSCVSPAPQLKRVEPLLIARRILREQLGVLHRQLLEIVRNDALLAQSERIVASNEALHLLAIPSFVSCADRAASERACRRNGFTRF